VIDDYCIRPAIFNPRQGNLRIDPSNIDEPVRIQDPQPPVMELEDAVSPEVAKHPVDVNARETGRIPDVLLSQGKMHLLDVMTRPSHSVSDEKLEEQMSHALARGVPADARKTLIGQPTIASNQQCQLHSDFWMLSE
jgi:hypothetical protein